MAAILDLCIPIFVFTDPRWRRLPGFPKNILHSSLALVYSIFCKALQVRKSGISIEAKTHTCLFSYHFNFWFFWFCELLLCKFMYVLRMTRHYVWQTFSVVYLYPLCGSKIHDFYWLIKGGQLPNVVFDPYPFEAYVYLYMLRFWHFSTLC